MLRFFRQPTGDSDEALLSRYRATGDLESLGRLYDRYVELIYGVCLKYLHEEAEAEDTVMNIFEELVEKVKAHEINQFRPWLYVLAKNHCLMKLRRDQRHPVENYDPALMHSVDTRHPIPEAPEDNGRETALRECLEGLSEAQRRCIELFYYQDHSYQEIAELLSERLGQVRSHIQNGRRNLRKCVEEKVGISREWGGEG